MLQLSGELGPFSVDAVREEIRSRTAHGEPHPGDVVVERAGSRVFVDPALAPALANVVVELDRGVKPPDLGLRSARSRDP